MNAQLERESHARQELTDFIREHRALLEIEDEIELDDKNLEIEPEWALHIAINGR
jgi:hypothetical protein